MTINEKMLEQIKLVHSSPDKWNGDSLLDHIDRIESTIKEHRIGSILDYGCGKAKHHPSHWRAVKYDPGVSEYSEKPTSNYDLVICTDVLEHIEEEYIDEVLAEIFQYANKFVYLCIGVHPAEEILPDGRNAHVLLKTCAWWRDKISQHKTVDHYVCWAWSANR